MTPKQNAAYLKRMREKAGAEFVKQSVGAKWLIREAFKARLQGPAFGPFKQRGLSELGIILVVLLVLAFAGSGFGWYGHGYYGWGGGGLLLVIVVILLVLGKL
jgi:hypothetical protein